ncbi:hypothetical protein G8A07_14420 [Roseateles sp. DAIF2]|uniref:hypothetical protein n=1 Tax=Roseateles sp. DAIF2 TaxID=2714952 RepID=UPI0018A31C85|nr:hypothetical protein [Roseateles sp. DAIF2]QPF73991.1 hypothetical protein G8A07_14420 [Roseateles sp. DAIF2]
MGTLIIALIGAGLSIFNLWYTRAKDALARRASIEDDYWMRKVIAPTVVESMCAKAATLIEELPDRTAPQDAQAAYSQNVTKMTAAMSSRLAMLQLVDTALPATVRGHLEAFEDVLLEYMNALAQASVTLAPGANVAATILIANPAQARDDAWQVLTKALKDIEYAHVNRHMQTPSLVSWMKGVWARMPWRK